MGSRMSDLLKEINKSVLDTGGVLPAPDSKLYWKRYRKLLTDADNECPAPKEAGRQGCWGRLPRSKARNLLEQLRACENDLLRFMNEPDVPFSNNQAENDIRMTNVQQNNRRYQGASAPGWRADFLSYPKLLVHLSETGHHCDRSLDAFV